MRRIPINGSDLTLADVADVAGGRAMATLAESARPAIERGASLVARIVAEGRRTYGINTGFGALSTETIPAADLRALQRNLLRSHAAGAGPRFDEPVVRAMLLLRANTLARGHSGVRPRVIERLLELLDLGVHPVVPSQGSVGASGDLAPLAHLALALIGEGRVVLDGVEIDAGEAHRRLKLEPLVLEPKEGLALINGTQATAAVGALALDEATSLLGHADLVGALTLEALGGRPSAFDPRLQALRPLPGPAASAANLRRLLAGSRLVDDRDPSLQDPYALRCMPQVHGAARESTGYARRVLAVEINSVTDNPILLPETGEVFSGGNFHGEPLAHALDVLAIGVTALAAIAERRLDRLISGAVPGLPQFLSPDPGLNSGLMMVHVTAAALLSECKLLSSPASVDSIPTSAGKEDHVSFSTHAARKARDVVENVAMVLAAELLAAAQALDFRGLELASPAARAVHARVRAAIPRLEEDREVHLDLAKARELIRSRELVAAAGGVE